MPVLRVEVALHSNVHYLSQIVTSSVVVIEAVLSVAASYYVEPLVVVAAVASAAVAADVVEHEIVDDSFYRYYAADVHEFGAVGVIAVVDERDDSDLDGH